MEQADFLCCRLPEGRAGLAGAAGWSRGGWQAQGGGGLGPGEEPCVKGKAQARGGACLPSFALSCFLLNLQSASPPQVESGVPGLRDRARSSLGELPPRPGLGAQGLAWCPLPCDTAEILTSSQTLRLLTCCVFCSSNKERADGQIDVILRSVRLRECVHSV